MKINGNIQKKYTENSFLYFLEKSMTRSVRRRIKNLQKELFSVLLIYDIRR